MNWYPIAFFIAVAVVFAILIAGVINLVRSDEGQRSRSNQLMRARVVAQFVAILILVAIGLLLGRVGLPGS